MQTHFKPIQNHSQTHPVIQTQSSQNPFNIELEIHSNPPKPHGQAGRKVYANIVVGHVPKFETANNRAGKPSWLRAE